MFRPFILYFFISCVLSFFRRVVLKLVSYGLISLFRYLFIYLFISRFFLQGWFLSLCSYLCISCFRYLLFIVSSVLYFGLSLCRDFFVRSLFRPFVLSIFPHFVISLLHGVRLLFRSVVISFVLSLGRLLVISAGSFVFRYWVTSLSFFR